MADNSAIEWTEATWNPVTGCTKASPGCKHCYAERMAKRLKAMGVANYKNGFEVTPHDHCLQLPLGWKKPKTIFVNSMSDLFHSRVPTAFIERVFAVMAKAHWHNFQVLTKRSGRLHQLKNKLHWASNIWMGVSVENADYTHRIDHLRDVEAAVRFISFEPLLGPISTLNLSGIDWAIVGGESGPGARPMPYAWVTQIRDQCVASDTPFFFKQWGGVRKKLAGRELDGRTWDEMPKAL
jgi:protein gp37